jgi:predicted nucleic acid-binding protein
MKGMAIVDTGPLVAGLRPRDQHHDWALSQLRQYAAPLLTCEAVVTEACYLLRKEPGGVAALFRLFGRGALRIAFSFEEERKPVEHLLARYASVPMAFADACLVRMLELYPGTLLLTVDSDFFVYRKNRANHSRGHGWE